MRVWIKQCPKLNADKEARDLLIESVSTYGKYMRRIRPLSTISYRAKDICAEINLNQGLLMTPEVVSIVLEALDFKLRTGESRLGPVWRLSLDIKVAMKECNVCVIERG